MATKLSIKNSTEADGNMSFLWSEDSQAVAENRKNFLGKFGLQLQDCVVMGLEHKDNIVLVDNSHRPKEPSDFVTADAFITQKKGLVLFLMTADCLPITFYDPVTSTLALAHVSWKCTDLKLSEKVIGKMKEEYQVQPENISVFIGPSIHKESYVHKAPLANHSLELKPFISELPSGDLAIDLVACNKAQMKSAGILEERIQVDPTDVGASLEYFSHYRAVRTGETEGRFATIAWLK